MTKKTVKIVTITGAAALLLWWLFKPKASSTPAVVGPTGDVLLGTPTVTGPSATAGGTDYLKPVDSTLPSTPDFYYSNGAPGYYVR